MPPPLVLSELPIACAVDCSVLTVYCSFCFSKRNDSSKDNFKRCSGCRLMHYCNPMCQRADWIDHKVECRVLKKRVPGTVSCGSDVGDPVASDGVRLMARIGNALCRGQEGTNRVPFVSSASPDRSFSDLVSHISEIRTDPSASAKALQAIESMKPFLSKEASGAAANSSGSTLGCCGLSPEELMEIYGKVKVNSFGIKDAELQTSGVGLYLHLCRLDHSCDPNGRILFRGRLATVVNVREESWPDGIGYEDIQHSYIDNLRGRLERQLLLKSEYYFSCDCKGCRNPERDAQMTGLTCCMKAGCPGLIPLISHDAYGPCTVCNRNLPDLDTVELIRHAMKTAEEKFGGAPPTFAVTLAVKLLELVSGSFGPNHAKRLYLNRVAYEACVKLEKWEEAAVYGDETNRLMSVYLNDRDPWLVVFRKNLAFAKVNGKKFEQAVWLLNCAKSFYEGVGWKDLPAYEKVCRTIVACERSVSNGRKKK